MKSSTIGGSASNMGWLSASVGNTVEVPVANFLKRSSSSEGSSGSDGVRSLEVLKLSFDLIQEVGVLIASILGAIEVAESIQKSSVLEHLSSFSVNTALTVVHLSVDRFAAA